MSLKNNLKSMDDFSKNERVNENLVRKDDEITNKPDVVNAELADIDAAEAIRANDGEASKPEHINGDNND